MKLLKILAISYAIKTALIGAAWLAIPDLPAKAMAAARDTWTWVAGPAVAGTQQQAVAKTAVTP
jgi:hypothetical protein